MHYHRQQIKTLGEHLPLVYQSRRFNSHFAWSLRLNTIITLELTGTIDQVFKLYLDYSDSRGKHGLFIDEVLWTGQEELVFSNLIHFPVKGPLEEPELVVSYRYPTVKAATKACLINCDSDDLPNGSRQFYSRITG